MDCHYFSLKNVFELVHQNVVKNGLNLTQSGLTTIWYNNLFWTRTAFQHNRLVCLIGEPAAFIDAELRDPLWLVNLFHSKCTPPYDINSNI